MLKIATHNSATGESPKDFISWITSPVYRTQTKTIKEQYLAGCRSFDIKINDINGEWHCTNKRFVTKRTAESIIEEINDFFDRCQVNITYEGTDIDNFKKLVHRWKSKYTNIIYGGIAFNDYGYYQFLELPYEGYERPLKRYTEITNFGTYLIFLIKLLIRKSPQFNNFQYICIDYL